MKVVVALSMLVVLFSGNPVTEAIRSVAMVKTADGRCTAFSPSISIWVTKVHCAEAGYTFKILGEVAELIREDKEHDLLLLRGPIVPPIKIAQVESETSDSLILLGWPVGWDDRVPYTSYGHMSALGVHRNIKGKKGLRLNAVDGTAYFGMSGGPVLNASGEVVGVIDSIAESPPIPIAYITPLKDLRKFLGLK